MQILDSSLFEPFQAAQFLEIVSDSVRVTEKKSGNLYQLVEAIPQLIEGVKTNREISSNQRLNLMGRIDNLNHQINHYKKGIDTSFWIGVLHVILLILTLGCFSYRESLKIEEIKLALPELFPETTSWTKVLLEASWSACPLFSKRSEELLSLWEKEDSPSLKEVITKKPHFLEQTPSEQIETLIELYEEAEDSSFRRSLRTVFAYYSASQIVEAINLTKEFDPLKNPPPPICVNLEDWIPLFSATHWEEAPPSLFFLLLLHCLEKKPVGFEKKIASLYLKHDPELKKISTFTLKRGGTYLLYDLFPIASLENIAKSQALVAKMEMSSLTPILSNTERPYAIGYMARLLSPEQIENLENDLFLQGAKNLFSQGALPPQKEDPNLTAWISLLLERKYIDKFLSTVTWLTISLDSPPTVFLHGSSPEFLWNLLTNIPEKSPHTRIPMGNIMTQLAGKIGIKKWQEMLQNPNPAIVHKFFRNGWLCNVADVLPFLEILEKLTPPHPYIAHLLINGCNTYLSAWQLKHAYPRLKKFKEECEELYLHLFMTNLPPSPTAESNKFFYTNSWTLSEKRVLTLAAVQEEALLTHIAKASKEIQEDLLELLAAPSSQPFRGKIEKRLQEII